MKPEANFDRVAKTFDFLRAGDTRRWSSSQLRFFSQLEGRVLYVGVGTGQEIINFPSGLDISGIDISAPMLQNAKHRARVYPGKMRLYQMDAERLAFADNHFDAILTVCVLCTVARPLPCLKELKRVLKPGGRIYSFEHVMSRNPLFGIPLQLMNPFSLKLTGTSLTRDTVSTISQSGFEVESVENVYLDIVKMIRAQKPAE
ncbi:MAG: class I SAM-dependent methyltransferase [Candidatus Nitrohelix vancouverensis]|uniref:Class I SAM-dependent methyltransferase n=1 Tax=Candidatus Nitrohelix vancouverensis TaxID=2705534 RepID=A0A7T0C374_9BACT|nr:MAG: class I SAM-dependent methyltransferase [Candidatus Nitrohelix vancouverensis]